MSYQGINPFNELYIAETIPPEQFVSLFSPYLVRDVQDGLALFQPGNVVLKGVQGTGKSMLLNLLKPEFRLAYKKANAELPIPRKLARFIGAGINLARSVAIDFGQRMIERDPFDDMESLPIYFGDFLNYWVVEDILNSINKLLSECNGAVGAELGINRSKKCFDKFATVLAREACWFGYLDSVRRFDELKGKIVQRISTYRSFLNYNIHSLPPDIRSTKTPIGEPISRTVEALWESDIVPRNVSFFIRIDQYEELLKLEDWSASLALKYREIVNKALSTRDPRISYRIGTRRYGWQDLKIFGTSSTLELERDYKVVDIDAILRRQENSRTWAFPDFAKDVFERRAAHSGYSVSPNSFERFLGKGLSSFEKARRYARPTSDEPLDEVLKLPRPWTKLYSNLRRNEPLEARLLEAWVLQNGLDQISQLEPTKPFPWDRKWWRKERIQHALMQIAHQRRQRMIWAGKDEVLALSGGNILVFVGICQSIWAAWVRATRGREDMQAIAIEVPAVEASIQAIGIHEASTQQYNKIEQKTGDSKKRQRFIEFLGRYFRQRMIHDRRLSYPGHNGFSLELDDLNSDEPIQVFLTDAVDYGDLFDAPHTTKMKDKRPRRKWYLNPIFSPHFQLPVTHVKEPIYVTVKDVRKWLTKAEQVIHSYGEEAPSSEGHQLPLFGIDTRSNNR
jgi:hypothetical protein